MKNTIIACVFAVVMLSMSLIFTNSCKKEQNITKPKKIPVLTTFPITEITTTTAIGGGKITLATTIDDFNEIDSLVRTNGLCWSTRERPTISDSKTAFKPFWNSNLNWDTIFYKFSCNIQDLIPNTTYFARTYAINRDGVFYGNEVSFISLPSVSLEVTDIDGNIYHTVTIGTQVWLAENLNTSRYRNGKLIENVIDSARWCTIRSGAYCDNKNDPGNSVEYGKLYNFYAIQDSSGIAPPGWHVATNAEWSKLYLGLSNSGGMLKETGTTHWNDPNVGATNEFGFTALPGGARSGHGEFITVGTIGVWWTSTKIFINEPNPYDMAASYSIVNDWGNLNYYESASFSNGYSIRCVRD
ncbi:MAG: fibrobacter succinogenes major paralogous domain-containing protein [Bacteroidota bacterium]